MRRVFPEPAHDISVEEACQSERARHADGRPWVEVCMVASVDGSTVVEGRSGRLSGPTDQQMLAALRRAADVVLVGAGTVRAEGYGPPKRPGLRIGVVTRRGDVDLTGTLFTSGAGFLVMPEDGPNLPIETVRAGQGEIDLPMVLRRLPGDPAIVHVEGGPSLNGALLAAAVVDEINLTTSPQLAGGTGARVTITDAAVGQAMALAHLALDDEGFVFSRWVRRASTE